MMCKRCRQLIDIDKEVMLARRMGLRKLNYGITQHSIDSSDINVAHQEAWQCIMASMLKFGGCYNLRTLYDASPDESIMAILDRAAL